MCIGRPSDYANRRGVHGGQRAQAPTVGSAPVAPTAPEHPGDKLDAAIGKVHDQRRASDQRIFQPIHE